MRAPMMRRLAPLIGTARPRPIPAIAVLTPTTRPRRSARAPPELPGLSAASVWMTFSTTRIVEPARAGSDRSSALTTPAVTEPARPIGLPTATTSSPTRSRSASPSSAAVRPSPRTRTRPRSERPSVPVTSKGSSRPSLRVAMPDLALPRTWADVSTKPSGVMTTPEPAPPESPPRPPPRPMTRSCTTDGRSRSATDVTTVE